MKVLYATSQTQGQRANDYSFCQEGELLLLPVVTCRGETADGPCGCARGLAGAASHRATTTAMVTETDLTEGEWLSFVAAALADSGWADSPATVSPDLIEAHRRLLADVRRFPAGTVVEFRDGRLAARTRSASA